MSWQSFLYIGTRFMSLADKLIMPKKLLVAAYVMMLTLWVAIGLEYFTDWATFKLVKTVFYFLVLEYVWTSVRREFFSSESK